MTTRWLQLPFKDGAIPKGGGRSDKEVEDYLAQRLDSELLMVHLRGLPDFDGAELLDLPVCSARSDDCRDGARSLVERISNLFGDIQVRRRS